MPTYDYRCSSCKKLTSVVCRISDSTPEVACEHCGETARKIISSVSVRLSNASKMEKLDPKYDKMVDRAMSNTQTADPDNYLKRMRPFDEKKQQ